MGSVAGEEEVEEEEPAVTEVKLDVIESSIFTYVPRCHPLLHLMSALNWQEPGNRARVWSGVPATHSRGVCITLH